MDVGETTPYFGELTRWRNDRLQQESNVEVKTVYTDSCLKIIKRKKGRGKICLIFVPVFTVEIRMRLK